MRQLTNRQTEILDLILKGDSTATIAHNLCREEVSIRSHTHKLCAKMQVRNRAELIDLFRKKEKAALKGIVERLQSVVVRQNEVALLEIYEDLKKLL